MKTIIFCKTIMAIAIILFLNNFSIIAQNWVTTGSSGTYVSPSEYSILGTDGTTLPSQQNVAFYSGGTQFMVLTNGGSLGIGVSSPVHILDVGGDINMYGYGYMLNSQYVLWDNANNSNIFVGASAGGIHPLGKYNTMTGSAAGSHHDTGSYNTFNGTQAGNFDLDGDYNTFIGAFTGFDNYGCNTCATQVGDWNTYVGAFAGFDNINGNNNNLFGLYTGSHNNTISENCLFGSYSGANASDSNVFMGNYSGQNAYGVNSDVFLGIESGKNAVDYWGTFVGAKTGTKNPGGNYNILMGYQADGYTGNPNRPGNIYNSVAIGADAIVNNNNQFILGNNSQFVGIGLSGITNGPQANLEIRTDANTVPPTVGSNGFIGNGLYNATNYYSGMGFSGLKFTDLTSQSTVVSPSSPNWNAETNPYPSGLLSVDGYGNVIYVPAPTASLGTCSSPTMLSPSINGAINLNGSNFEFQGNGAGASADNVSIGFPTCTVPVAKFNIWQASGSNNTMGEYILNMDASNGVSGTPIPLIGIKSLIPQPANETYYNVAGWFEADGLNSIFGGYQEYGIFVPEIYEGTGGYMPGGTVDIGYDFQLDIPDYLLDVNGYARIAGTVIPSDSNLKKNIAPFKYGLKAIRNLNPISYKYNGIGGFDSSKAYIGLIAQNLQRNVPSGVKSSKIVKDTINRDTATILNIYEEAVMYTAVNAIKELDSTVTSNKHTDSVIQSNQQQTIDSLRTVLNSIQTCLNNLCNNAHAPHHNGANENSDSNATSNFQDVTLSSVNSPLLYQNIPNPFSTGTKINYYLPQGTMGATIVFYDSYGYQIKQVQLSQTGNGTLNITPDNLTNGIYSYSLIVNGNVIDTKRMVLQK